MGEDERELRQQIEQLYALPPAAFTAARQELAARLRREGRRQDAVAVKALRRPTPAAWAVGRLLRLEPQRFKEMLEAGRQARQAQHRVLAGKGSSSEAAAGALRESLSTAKRLVEELRRRGLELLGGAARPPTAAIADRLTADLQALAYTAGAEKVLAPGWLDHDLEAPGFEVLAGLQAAARKGPARRPVPEAQTAGSAAPAQFPAAVAEARRQPSRTAPGREAPVGGRQSEPGPGAAGDQARGLGDRQREAAAKAPRPAASVAAAAASDASRRTEERQRARVAAAAAAVERAREEVAEGRAAAAAAERDAAAAERAAAAAERRAEQARAEAQRERRRAEQAEEQLRRAREHLAAARSTPG